MVVSWVLWFSISSGNFVNKAACSRDEDNFFQRKNLEFLGVHLVPVSVVTLVRSCFGKKKYSKVNITCKETHGEHKPFWTEHWKHYTISASLVTRRTTYNNKNMPSFPIASLIRILGQRSESSKHKAENN